MKYARIFIVYYQILCPLKNILKDSVSDGLSGCAAHVILYLVVPLVRIGVITPCRRLSAGSLQIRRVAFDR
jgi:hypothetical protein